MKEIHCLSISCNSRKSKCCNAKSKSVAWLERTGYYVCATCGNKFIPKEHSCAVSVTYMQILPGGHCFTCHKNFKENSENHLCFRDCKPTACKMKCDSRYVEHNPMNKEETTPQPKL